MKDIFDLGLLNNIARFYTYALAGAHNIRELKKNMQTGWVNRTLLLAVHRVSNALYTAILLLIFIVLSTLGTWLVSDFLDLSDGLQLTVWIVQIIAMSMWIYGNRYLSILIGYNKIALLRRWDSLLGSFQVLFSTLIIILFTNIWFLLINIFLWHSITVIRNYFLARKSHNIESYDQPRESVKKYVYHVIIPRASKSFLSGLLSLGLAQLLTVFYASVSTVQSSSSYLLAMRLMEQIKQISRAPFYSKIPQFARQTIGSNDELLKNLRRSKILSYSVLVLAIIAVLLLSSVLLDLISSDTEFVSSILWLIIGLSVVIERFTAMHNELFTLSRNQVVSHYALSIAAIVNLAIVYFLFDELDVYVFPISLMCSYLVFYSWFVASKNYKTFKVSFWKYEKYHFLPALSIILLLLIFYLVSCEVFVSCT
ncbi:hypothetical protein [Ekhidna sp.]|uniref:hypothetical protein n=1 Tax=Ekhidna sp. TaxID=2608089 RepID=UPI0035129D73